MSTVAMDSLSKDDATAEARISSLTFEPSPADLVRRAEIMAAIPSAPKVFGRSDRGVARISDSLVTKFGPHTRLCEARNMVFAAERAGVRVPKVYDAWEVRDESTADEFVEEDPSAIIGYILMDFVPGTVVDEAWPRLDDCARDDVVRQIADMLEKMHSCKLTGPGSLGSGRAPELLHCMTDPPPFTSARHMEAWFNERLQVCKDFKRLRQDEPDFTGYFRDLVFCHRDLHSHNVILDADQQVWLIDWGRAGGYPVYFEEYHVNWNPNSSFADALEKLICDPAHAPQIAYVSRIVFALTTGCHCLPSKPIEGIVLRSLVHGVLKAS